MTVTTHPLDRRNHFAETLKADARRILDACGVPARPNWVNRQVTAYVDRVAHTGFPFGPWLVSRVQLTTEQRLRAMHDPEVHSFLAYPDPTGEDAVHNVMTRGPRRDGY